VAQTQVIACWIEPRQATDCFIGKWKLDTEKSYADSTYRRQFLPKFHADLKLKRGSATFRRDGNGYVFDISAEFNDGPLGFAGPATFDNHAYKGVWGGKKVVFASDRVGDHGFKLSIANEQTLKVTEVLLFNVSSDDTTLVLSDLPIGKKSPPLTLVFNKR
jgi:hypothetical protein